MSADKREITVLVVENERLIARHLRQTLEQAGYTVVGTAASAEEAYALCAEQTPRIVLMDIGLDGSVDGITAAAQLLEQYGLRVIYLTGSVDVRSLDRAKRTRPHAYLQKPINLSELFGAVELASFARAPTSPTN